MAFSANKPTRKGGLFLFGLAATAALVAAVWLLFGPALPGMMHFDDAANLSGLAAITDFDSARRWVGEGRAGPLGRPLALATFALQYYQWPDLQAFLVWNIWLHAINALLVFWLALLLAARLRQPPAAQLVLGFCVALTWAVLPLLGTSVLFIVQRMTLLSATFVLLGLIAYLKLRGPATASWPRQVAALLALAALGALSLYAKENGALIVVYALVLELFLLVSAGRRRPTLAVLVLFAGNAVLLAALLRYASWSSCAELTRGYTALDRLGSQGLILPAYLKALFLPVSAELNPFRFAQLLRGGVRMPWGLAIWAVLMALPLLAWVKRWRLLALALAWFFYGHIMESSWLSLEPYFAHRNYLPAAGLVFLLVAGVFSLRAQAGLWRGVLVAYMVLLATVGWMNTSLWGERALAAEIWAKQEPHSIRAALNLGRQLERAQGLAAAQHYLDRFMLDDRDSVGLRMQRLVTACSLSPAADHAALVHDVKHAIQTLPYEGWATDLAEDLLKATSTHDCNGVPLNEVAAIAGAFLNQPAYQCSKAITHNLLRVLGFVALRQGQVQVAMDFFYQALQQSANYSLTNYYLDLVLQHGNTTDLQNLHKIVAGSATPRATSGAEWRQLVSRIESASSSRQDNSAR